VVIETPYQMRRKPAGHWTGELCISGDLAQTCDCMRQSVSDVRALISYLRFEGAGKIGVQGMSMGGWITSLTAASEPGLDLVVVAVPPVELMTILDESSLVRTIREDILESGIDMGVVQKISDLLSPLSYPLKSPSERVRLIKSEHDLILPPDGAVKLWEHWGRPILRTYSHGHLSFIISRRFLKDFINDCVDCLG